MRVAFVLASTLAVLACTSVAQPDAPAMIVDPTPESRAELSRAVSAALNRADVTLADDALTHDSALVIEPTPARDAAGQRLSGRDLGRPEQFQLITSNGRCVLVHARSGQRHALEHTRCKAR
jgi:hypothetical protein